MIRTTLVALFTLVMLFDHAALGKTGNWTGQVSSCRTLGLTYCAETGTNPKNRWCRKSFYYDGPDDAGIWYEYQKDVISSTSGDITPWQIWFYDCQNVPPNYNDKVNIPTAQCPCYQAYRRHKKKK